MEDEGESTRKDEKGRKLVDWRNVGSIKQWRHINKGRGGILHFLSSSFFSISFALNLDHYQSK